MECALALERAQGAASFWRGTAISLFLVCLVLGLLWRFHAKS